MTEPSRRREASTHKRRQPQPRTWTLTTTVCRLADTTRGGSDHDSLDAGSAAGQNRNETSRSNTQPCIPWVSSTALRPPIYRTRVRTIHMQAPSGGFAHLDVGLSYTKYDTRPMRRPTQPGPGPNVVLVLRDQPTGLAGIEGEV